MAGLTPFQFSSGKRQHDVLLGYKPTGMLSNLAADAISDMLAWYEMWINPASITKQSKYRQTQQHSAGAIVNYFYRPEYTVMSCQGKIGWVRIHSVLEEVKANAVSNLIRGEKSIKDVNSGVSALDGAKEALEDYAHLPWNIKSSHANRFNNSPLQFLRRLKALADEPMYYIDDEGVEHFNPKFIKCFTKEYPDGIMYKGFFDTFTIDENTDLGETLSYQFVYVIQSETPVTLIQRVLGAYAGFGSAIGDLTSLASGVL
jgi:hypothetical protein